MRWIIFSALLIAACSTEPADPGPAPGLFAGEGRDALCMSGTSGEQRAGFITYGQGGNNCSARGRIERQGSILSVVPHGEGDCRIPLVVDGDRISMGPGHPSCDYYCGPGATFAGKNFRRVAPGDAAAAARNPMTDFAGEPLC